MLQAPRDLRIQLEFVNDFGLYFHNAETCFHWVEVKYDGVFSNNGPRCVFTLYFLLSCILSPEDELSSNLCMTISVGETVKQFREMTLP